MNEPYFKDAKVGDKVYSLIGGFGEITERTIYLGISRLHIEFPYRKDEYDLDGCLGGAYDQVLFWDKPEIIAPPKPKRKEKRTIEGWVNVYEDGATRYYQTLEEAQNGIRERMNECVRKIACVRVTGEYEVEQ